MRIHILQHEIFETPGCIENWIKERSCFSSTTELYTGQPLPEISGIDCLVIMGGSMSVHDTDDFPWLAEEKKFIKEAIDSGKIVIGICLGSQLIADVLGSRVYKNSEKEIGWFPVRRIDSGAGTDLFNSFDNIETVFHWHGDTFDLPAGAKRCFTSDATENQCFIYKDRVLGLQFHVEVTDELLEGMIINGAGEFVPGRYIMGPDQLRAGSVNIKRNNDLIYSILDKLAGLRSADSHGVCIR